MTPLAQFLVPPMIMFRRTNALCLFQVSQVEESVNAAVGLES